MRLSVRSIASVLLVAAVLSPLPSVDGASAGRPPRLAGTTVMNVARPSVTTVVLPKAVRVWHPSFDPDRPDFAIDGGSGFAAFALMKIDRTPRPTGLLGGRLPEEGRSEPFLTGIELKPSAPDWTGFWTVPRGRYRLFLFTDDPVRLTLFLAGLGGKTEVVLTEPARYEVKDPARVIDTAPANNLYSAGATGTLDGKVAQLQLLWTRESAHLSSQTGFCWYDDAPADPAAAYMPGCPFADSQDILELTGDFVGDWFFVAYGLRLPVPTGKSGQGMWFASAAAIREMGHLTAWLDLDLD